MGQGHGGLSKEGAGVRTNYDNSLPKRKTDSRLRGLSEKRGEYGPDLRFEVRGESIGFFFFCWTALDSGEGGDRGAGGDSCCSQCGPGM